MPPTVKLPPEPLTVPAVGVEPSPQSIVALKSLGLWLYWSVNAPRTGGLAIGFFAGLMLDVFQGPVLGEHALALSLVTYIAVREHQRIRSKPVIQQALIVFAALIVYEVVLFMIDGWTGHPVTSPLRWVHTVTGALIWPPAAAILSYGAGHRV